VGVILGLMMKFMFLTLEFAGSLISQAIGLTNVSFHSPAIGGQISLPSNLLMIAGALLLMVTDMHHYFIRIIYESYALISFSSFEFNSLTELLLKSSQRMISLGFKLSTPLVIFGLLVSIVLGILNRLIPQVQIFMVSQPLQIGFGFFVFLYAIRELLMTFLKDYKNFLLEWGI
jgi:flagellar biosynthetic protein FliR